MVGWSALAAGLGVVLARYTWEQPLWLIPYALFWVWIIALAIRRVPERVRPRLRAASGSRPPPHPRRPRALNLALLGSGTNVELTSTQPSPQ
jgi:hypothetical protein